MVLVYGVGRIDKLVVGMKNKRPICFVGLILLESMELVGLIYVWFGISVNVRFSVACKALAMEFVELVNV